MRITQQNRKKVLKMLGNQIFSRLNYGDRNGGGLLKMAGIDYPRYLQTLDLLNIMIAILVYDGCKLYKYGYFFPKKVEITKAKWAFAIIWHQSYTSTMHCDHKVQEIPNFSYNYLWGIFICSNIFYLTCLFKSEDTPILLSGLVLLIGPASFCMTSTLGNFSFFILTLHFSNNLLIPFLSFLKKTYLT